MRQLRFVGLRINDGSITKRGQVGVYSEKYGYVFIHQPKTAGTSVTAALLEKGDAIPFGEIDGLTEIVTSENQRLGMNIHGTMHTRASDVRLALGEDSYDRLESFATVRNPWDHLWSL